MNDFHVMLMAKDETDSGISCGGEGILMAQSTDHRQPSEHPHITDITSFDGDPSSMAKPSAPAPDTTTQDTDVEEQIILDENGVPIPPPLRLSKEVATAVVEAMPAASLPPPPPPVPSAQAISVQAVAAEDNANNNNTVDRAEFDQWKKRQRLIVLGLILVVAALVIAIVALNINSSGSSSEDVPPPKQQFQLLPTSSPTQQYQLAPPLSTSSPSLLSNETNTKSPMAESTNSPSKTPTPSNRLPTLPILDSHSFTSSSQSMEEYAYKNNLEIISGTAWSDDNANGVRDENENNPYLGYNVDVNLLGCDGEFKATTHIMTSEEGYAFVGVPAGWYNLKFSLSYGEDLANTVFTLPLVVPLAEEWSISSDVVDQDEGTTECIEVTVGDPLSLGYVFNAGFTQKIGQSLETAFELYNSCPDPNPCPSEFTGYTTCPGSWCAVFVECLQGGLSSSTYKCPTGWIFDESIQGCNWESCCSDACKYT